MKKNSYDPTREVIKDIPELIAELNKLIMPKLPGGRPVQTVWGVLCEASRARTEAMSFLEDEEDGLNNRVWKLYGEIQVADRIIRKIADGMGVDNFKMREVPGGQDG